LRASTVCNSIPSVRAISEIASSPASVLLAGSRSTPKRRAKGTISFRISSFLASSSVARMLIPVVLLPGAAHAVD
jgi:hypothetical protein